MCLTLYFNLKKEGKELAKPLVASKDITVYKVVRITDIWDFNKRGWVEAIVTPHRSFKVELGMHYYQTGKKFGIIQSSWQIHISDGLHSYKTLRQAKRNVSLNKYRIVKCIVPKGSEYYHNETHMVSDNLIYGTEFVK